MNRISAIVVVGIIVAIAIVVAVGIFGVLWYKRIGKYYWVSCSRSISYFKTFSDAETKMPK